MNPNDREQYEERLREKHPESLWWEDWRQHKWLIFWVVVAVVVAIAVGFAVG